MPASRDRRQGPLGPARKPTFQKLALQLQADQQEEQGHEAVVDPEMRRHRPQPIRQRRADRPVQQVMIQMRAGQVGRDHREERRSHEKQATGRLAAQDGEASLGGIVMGLVGHAKPRLSLSRHRACHAG